MAALRTTTVFVPIRLGNPGRLKHDLTAQKCLLSSSSCDGCRQEQQKKKMGKKSKQRMSHKKARVIHSMLSANQLRFLSSSSNRDMSESDNVKIGETPSILLRRNLSWSKLKSSLGPVLKSMAAVNFESPLKSKSVSAGDLSDALKNQIVGLLERVKQGKTDESEKKAEVENKESCVKSQSYIYEGRKVGREEHDFKDAMALMHESINDYFKPTEKSVETKSGFENLAQKKYKPESYVSFSKTFMSLLSNDKSSKDSEGLTLVKRIEPLVDRVIDVIPAEYRKRKNGKAAVAKRKEVYSKSAINSRTRALVAALKTASSEASRLVRMEELSRHILLYPESHGAAVKERVIPFLIQIRDTAPNALGAQARECLALVGHVDPLASRGIRILALDGGGTRGLISINMLKKIERLANQPVHKLFDYICGVSTGALIAALLGCFRVPLDECERAYKQFSLEMFQRSSIVGAGKLFLNHAFYDTDMWTNILKSNLGDGFLIDTARVEECPKMSMVSTIINRPNIQNFMFRNYNLPRGVESHYSGSCQYKVWEAVRASSAAPGYYEECVMGDLVHQDGGVLTNNPTALAIHECRLLWPNEPLQCVVSLGNGRYEPSEVPDPDSYTSLKGKIVKFVQSATDTQAVDTMLHDLLPPSTYFRFNPYMSEDFQLDEIRAVKLDQLMQDTEMYVRKNEHKIESAVQQLLLQRRPHQKLNDWVQQYQAMKN